MKILTWNINGLRAVKGTSTKSLLDSLNADIICLQETKVTRDMLDEPTAIVDGYESYFSCSRKRTGYSGTANYCSSQAFPVKAEEGLTGKLSTENDTLVKCYGDMEYLEEDLARLDAEGRCIITQHQIRLSSNKVEDVAIINVYVPRAGDREDRLEYKLKFLSLLQCRAEALLRENIHVIILGDLNLTHTILDNCDPKSDGDFQLRSSRIWINEMLQKAEQDSALPSSDYNLRKFTLPDLEGGHFSDIYRHLHPTEATGYTNWCSSTDARKANYGRRLDYILIDTALAKYATTCEILMEVEGSDHCPVVVTLDCEPVSSANTPLLCTKFMPEFKGQQQKLSSFFVKSEKQGLKQSNYPTLSPSQSSQKQNSQTDHSSPLKKSLSLTSSSPPKMALSKCATEGAKTKNYSEKSAAVKRGSISTAKGTAKKAKTKQEESGSKQASLTFFFSKSRVSKVEDGQNELQSSANCSESGQEKDFDLSEKKTDKQMNTESSCHIDLSQVDDDEPSSQTSTSSPAENDQLSSSGSSQTNGIASSGELKTDSVMTTPAVDIVVTTSQSSTKSASSQAWKSLLKGPEPPPLCPGHKEPCILKTVNKKGPNKDRKFYICARPEGAPGNPEFRCNYFRWQTERKKKN